MRLKFPLATGFCLISFFAHRAFAIDLQVELVGTTLVHDQANPTLPGQTVGALTEAVLQEAVLKGNLTFEGSDAGLLKVNGRGGELEVLSDTQMRAYGWCYSVDGQLSELMADQYALDQHPPFPKRIRWYYAYAYYDAGTWTDYCVPADHLPKQE